MVALQDFGGRVQSVLWEEVVDVNGVEDQRNDPVADDWQGSLYERVGDPRGKRLQRRERVFGERREVVRGGIGARHGVVGTSRVQESVERGRGYGERRIEERPGRGCVYM